MTPQTANNVLAIGSWLYVMSALVIPAISDRIGLRRPVFCFSLLFSGFGIYMVFMSEAPAIWLWACLWGSTLGVFPLLFTIPFELPDVGPELGGSALGMISAAGNLGGFIFLMVIASITDRMELGQAAVYIGILCGFIGYLLAGILIWKIPETGCGKAEKHQLPILPAEQFD